MMKLWVDRAAALVCVAVCACAGAFPASLLTEPLQAQSRHQAGSVWCRYDARGVLAERQLDTNGDGRPDVVEYYRDGALLRRDSDRNFNGVTDLVEDFDEVTQEHVRSIVDQDYDGTADLLLLYRHGEPVVSERAPADLPRDRRSERARQDTSTVLVSLRNPFSASPALDSSAVPAPHETWIGPSPVAGVVASAANLPPPAPALTSRPRSVRVDLNAHRSLRSPRGPPRA